MKIAIISDTHGNAANFKKVINWLNKNNISLILHCGDIGSPESLKESLADFKGDFFGVLGNMDKDYKIRLEEYNKIPRVKINEDILETEIENPSAGSGQVKIAITHKPKPAKKLAESGRYDLIFYGHTHKPCLARRSFSKGGGRKKECLLINPGELAGQFYKPTFAVYDTDIDKLELKILEKL
ncbi:MAG: phosphodiesterase, MJ0936 family [Parcubacteria group bacterium Licking1014_1]|nr:MAG: phosphodiesterase, MJ0936 family [Parcubacteria group bacterium Licking1014_1]